MAITKWEALFADGWYPRISPDGKYVLCGSSAGRILEIASKKSFLLTGAYSCGWLNATQAMYYASGADGWGARRVEAPAFDTPVRIGPGANFFGCGGNQWASGNTREIWAGDNTGHARKIAEGYSATCDETGTICYSIDVHTASKIVVWRNGQILRTITPAAAPNAQKIGAGGYVGYGYYGPSWLNTPDNQNMEVGVTPDRKESPPLAFRHNGAVWLATTNDQGVYLRPLGTRDRAIIISIPFHDPYGGAVDCSVVSLGDHFLVASNDAKGKLTIAHVPASEALLPVPKPPAPEPGPDPEPPVKAKATIDTYEGEITLPDTARAVAKVTQGRPERFRWQYAKGEEWILAADNPATDLDHHYAFEAEGRYPIRIQTLVDGKVVDQSSSTSRAVTVHPAEAPGPEPPDPPQPTPARKGLVRSVGRRFVDDGGAFNPLGGTLFWAMRGWKYERDRIKKNIEYLARYRFDYMRILAQVGWTGNEISEKWPDHIEILMSVIDYAYSVGLRTQVTGIGGGTYDPDKVIDNMIAAIRGREHKVIYNEVCNEWYGNFTQGETKLKALGARLRKALPNLVALSAPREELATDKNKGWVADKAASMGTMHLDRTDKKADWKWRHVRKPWECRNPSFAESHGEPGGPLSSVASYMEPIHLVMSRAVGLLCGVEAYCLHNGAGVGGQVDPAHHRPANLWEVPGIDRCMETVRALEKIIPNAPSNGNATRTGLSGHPLTADQFWPDHSEYDHGLVRDYARRDGKTFWQCLQGIKNYVNLKSDRTYRLTFFDPVTLASHERVVGAGKSIKVERGSVDTRKYGAWIVRGAE